MDTLRKKIRLKNSHRYIIAATDTADKADAIERRRRRNREASRRYRERARGDPELLRWMREQQNRWAITH